MAPFNPLIRQWWVTALVLTGILLLSFIPDNIHGLLELRHQPIARGEWWRLYSCHLVHLSFNHTLLNLAGYSIVAFSFRDEISPWRELLILFISATAVGVGIYQFNPEMYSYVGLSGAIYGVLVAYAIIGFNQTPVIAAGFIAFIVGKFVYEALIGGANPETEAFIGGRVATDSHLYGALSGILPGLFFFWRDRKERVFLDTIAFVNRFKESIVRDLAWALHSPPLIHINNKDFDTVSRNECAQMAWDYLDELKALDKNPQPLIDAVKPDTLRLGLYFESLLAYWLSHQTRYELRHHGLTVQDGTRTVGEFDFIVYDTETDQTQHWEVAVKFYLGIKTYHEPSLWYGPGKKDRFDIKLNHLTEKQILMSHNPHGAKTLESAGIAIEQRRLFVKGRLFYPAHAREQADPIRKRLCAQHLRGYWYQCQQIIQMSSPKALGYYPWQQPLFCIAGKEEWLTLKQQPTMNFRELQATLEQNPLARPVTIVAKLGKRESRRFFVVPDNWEEAAAEA